MSVRRLRSTWYISSAQDANARYRCWRGRSMGGTCAPLDGRSRGEDCRGLAAVDQRRTTPSTKNSADDTRFATNVISITRNGRRARFCSEDICPFRYSIENRKGSDVFRSDHAAVCSVRCRHIGHIESPDARPDFRNVSQSFRHVNELLSPQIVRRGIDRNNASRIDESPQKQQAAQQCLTHEHPP